MDFLGSSKMSSPILAYVSQPNLESGIVPNWVGIDEIWTGARLLVRSVEL